MWIRVLVVALLVGAPVLAEKPWETRIDLVVPIPVELPTIQPENPFFTAVSSPPVMTRAPLQEKWSASFPIVVAAYIDSSGACRRTVPVRTPWSGLGPELQATFAATSFTPGRSLGTAVATWLPATVDVSGRIDRGRVQAIQVTMPDRESPPEAESVTAPAVEDRDLGLQAVPVERLDQLPAPKRFRLRLEARTWRENVRLLVEVGVSGKVERVVFLACPEGLREWLLASLSGWAFQPAQGGDGTSLAAWAVVEATVEVSVDRLTGESLRVSRETVYPLAPAQSAAGPPPGA